MVERDTSWSGAFRLTLGRWGKSWVRELEREQPDVGLKCMCFAMMCVAGGGEMVPDGFAGIDAVFAGGSRWLLLLGVVVKWGEEVDLRESLHPVNPTP